MKKYLVLKTVATGQTMLEKGSVVWLDPADEGNKFSKVKYVVEYIAPKADKKGKLINA
jgi:hypothetical protein